MNIVFFHKRDLQLVIQYLSIARITGLSEELWFFSANPRLYSNNTFSGSTCTIYLVSRCQTAFFSFIFGREKKSEYKRKKAVWQRETTIYYLWYTPSITHVYTLTTASSVNNALLAKQAPKNDNVFLINTHRRSRARHVARRINVN